MLVPAVRTVHTHGVTDGHGTVGDAFFSNSRSHFVSQEQGMLHKSAAVQPLWDTQKRCNF